MLNSADYTFLLCVLNSVLNSSENMVSFETASEFYSDYWKPSGGRCVCEGKHCQQDLVEEACIGLLCLGGLECPKCIIIEDLLLESKSLQKL